MVSSIPQIAFSQDSDSRKNLITVRFFPLSSFEVCTQNISSIKGPLTLWYWFEGIAGLPKPGADFLGKLFDSLNQVKKDIEWKLYSLKGWDFNKNVKNMASSTALGEAVNRLNRTSLKCVYAFSFFQFCLQRQNAEFCCYVNQEWLKKKWLKELSADRKKKGIAVSEFFQKQVALFESIKDLDVNEAYPFLQYMEGYYLIRDSLKQALLKGEKKIPIAFLLPNDEGSYYQDFPSEMEKMLRLDFGSLIDYVEIEVTFHFFQYRDRSSRPYIEKNKEIPFLKPGEIPLYFPSAEKRIFTPRDIIHKF